MKRPISAAIEHGACDDRRHGNDTGALASNATIELTKVFHAGVGEGVG